jgi:hypothetical protein
VIVMRIDDTLGSDVDPALRGLVAVLNAGATDVNQRLPGLVGHDLTLSPVQASGSDPVVKTSTWDASSGVAHVPARTVAVLVEAQ